MMRITKTYRLPLWMESYWLTATLCRTAGGARVVWSGRCKTRSFSLRRPVITWRGYYESYWMGGSGGLTSVSVLVLDDSRSGQSDHCRPYPVPGTGHPNLTLCSAKNLSVYYVDIWRPPLAMIEINIKFMLIDVSSNLNDSCYVDGQFIINYIVHLTISNGNLEIHHRISLVLDQVKTNEWYLFAWFRAALCGVRTPLVR